MADYVYRSETDLRNLGAQIRDRAVQKIVDEGDEYGRVQVEVNNYGSQIATGVRQPLPGFQPSGDWAHEADEHDVRAYAMAEYANLPDMFATFTIPDPAGIQPAIDIFRRVCNTLDPDLSLTADAGTGKPSYTQYPTYGVAAEPLANTIAITRQRSQDWRGPAAEGFQHYLATFEKTVELQRQVLQSLAVGLMIQQEMRKRLLTDVWQIGQATLIAIDRADAWCPGSTKSDVAVTLTIIGTIAAVMVAIESDGLLSLAAGAEITQGLGSLLAFAPKLDPIAVTGKTVPAVIQSMADVLQKEWSALFDMQNDLVTSMSAFFGDVMKYRSALTLAAPFDTVALGTADVNTLSNGHLFYDP